MAYKRYIRKNGKLYGPYLYKSVRDKKGNVRNIYVGRGSEQKRASILDIFQRALLPFTSRNGKVAALFILAFISTTLLLAGIGSAVFDRLTVQGQLRDSSNEILSGNYNFSFNIYAQATGGTSLFEQNFTDLIVDSNGIYTATLTDISLPFSQNYYLGVNVDSDGEMLPRMNITDTGTAFRSNRSEYLGANLPSYFLNTSTETQTTGGSFVVTGNFTVNTDTFVIDTSVARIGIGTSSPNASLHVNGSFLQTHMSPTAIGNITDDSKGGPAPSLNGAYDVFVSGKYAYVASYSDDALQIIDISDPSNPTAIGNITDDSVGGPAPSLNNARSVYVSGKYAYVASKDDDALQIIDISDPSNPTAIGNITDDSVGGPAPSLDGPYSVYVSGKYAYVASWDDDSLQIIDISDPSNPTAIGNITDDSKGGPAPSLNGAYDVFVSGKYAYVASWGDHALQIIDISDPSNPTAIGNITDDSVGGPAPSLAGANGVYVSGKYAYVASYSDSALQIIDISDPSNPTAIGNITDDSKGGPAPSLAGANGVYVSGKYAYVASKGDDALQIIDISDPSNPTAIGNITDDSVGGPAPSLNNARSVYVSGKYAYVASWDDDSLQIIDIGGIDAPAATIGDLAVGTLDVWENADIANDLSVGSGLVVGPGGIYSQGDVAINGSINVTSGNDVCIVGGNCLSTLSGGSGGNTTAEVRAAINGSDSWFTSIGIGTATPSQKLQVSDGSILLSDGYSIYWDSTSNGINYDTTNGFRFYNGGEIDQQFKADGEAYLGLNGNVGIGTTSPTYKLEINSTDNALNVSNFLFANSTRVGIGTANPSTALGVSGNITSSDSVIVTTGISIGGDYRTEWPTGTGNTSAEMIAATNNTAHWNASRIQGSTELCIGTDCKSSWSSVGINRTLYFNKTAETYTGELSAGGYTGYEAGDYICDSNFTGTHLCQEYEIVQTMTYKNISEIDDWDGYAWYSSGGPKYTGASPANDCNGFTDGTASYLGSFWKFNQTGGGSGAMVNCAELKSLACCKAW